MCVLGWMVSRAPLVLPYPRALLPMPTPTDSSLPRPFCHAVRPSLRRTSTGEPLPTPCRSTRSSGATFSCVRCLSCRQRQPLAFGRRMHVAFGRVVSGTELVDRLENQRTLENDRPIRSSSFADPLVFLVFSLPKRVCDLESYERPRLIL